MCIKYVHTHNALEFKSSSLLQFHVKHEFDLNLQVLVLVNKNDIVERKYKQLLNIIRTLTNQMNMPAYFLGHTILTTSYANNHLSWSAIENQVPIQILYPNRPLFLIAPKVKVLSCTCFVHVIESYRDKLVAPAIKRIFTGYPSHQKWYKYYDPTTCPQCECDLPWISILLL